jgi:cytochrome oxidase Cu insertion factor (SCO1/SenC/PrrC family)
MKNIILKITFFILISNLTSQNIKTIGIGDKAYNYIGIDKNGNELKIDHFKGNYILLNFTHTYCKSCWVTYNYMDKFQEKYKENLIVISFHLDNEKEKWKEMARKKGVNFNCISIWESKEKSKIEKIYNIKGFPQYFLIDKNGIIIAKWFGNFEDKLADNLKKHIH